MRFVAQGARCDSQAPGIGAGAIALLAVIYLFSKRRRYGQEKFFIVLLTVFSLFPLFGWTMNGFSYATNNRWHLGFVLTLSWVVVQTLPDLLQETKIQKGIIGFAGFYTIVTCCFYIPFLEDRRNLLVCAMLLMGSMLFGFTIPWRNYFALQRSKNHSGRGRKAVAGALSIVFIFVCVAAVNSDEKDIGKQNTLRYSFNAGETQSLLTDDSALDMVKNDNSFFRVTRPTTQIVERNRELLFGLGSPLGYWSITNKYISQFRRALGTEKFRQFVVQSNDSATYVEALLCTKYLLPTASVPTIPYGYRKILTKGNDGNNYEVYQNEYFLPLGTTYNTYVTEKDFYTLSYEQRQQVMLQSLLVDDQKVARKLKLKKSHSSQSAAAVAYTAESDNHIYLGRGKQNNHGKTAGNHCAIFPKFS